MRTSRAATPRFGKQAPRKMNFATDDTAEAGVQGILTAVFAVIIALIGAVVVFTAAADLLPSAFTALADVVSAMTGANTNTTTGDVLLASFALLVVVAFCIGIVLLLIRASGIAGGNKF